MSKLIYSEFEVRKSLKPKWIQINKATDVSFSDKYVVISSYETTLRIGREDFESIKDNFENFLFPLPEKEVKKTTVQVAQKVVEADFKNKSFKKAFEVVETDELVVYVNEEMRGPYISVKSYTDLTGEKVTIIDNGAESVHLKKATLEKIITLDDNDFTADNVIPFPKMTRAV